MKKRRKVDRTTNKAFNKMPSQASWNGDALRNELTPKRPVPGGPGGRKWRTLGKQPAP